jgi:hypothetical protein
MGLGAKRIYCKLLAENDNSKQQVYFGGSFEILKQLPYMDIREEPGGKRPNFKASLDMSWINAEGHTALAPGAQLILYPDYPEVRLSGFLRGCPIAPSHLMQPVPSAERKFNNGPDGRVLFLGVTESGNIYAYLSSADSNVSKDFLGLISSDSVTKTGVFWLIPPPAEENSREKLLSALKAIHHAGWHESRRLNRQGQVISYTAQNGGGYTLEALLGIIPNGIAEPDYLGWEVKAYSSGRVTLMTPEPDLGFYGTHGVEAFVRKYGRDTGGDTLYFTGTHRSNQLCEASQQTLKLEGFAPNQAGSGKITDVGGGILLIDCAGEIGAGWSFRRLMEHWGRKHAAAAYVPYSKQADLPPLYRYDSPVLLGEETAFELYLGAIDAGHVVYDPAPKITNASTLNSRVKARSQFRIPIKKLPSLYKKFSAVDLD